jgi:hypothetical protein
VSFASKNRRPKQVLIARFSIDNAAPMLATKQYLLVTQRLNPQ